MFRILLAIGFGGFLGSILRFLVSRWTTQWFVSSFPFGTFVVNILGCLAIGFLYGLSERGQLLSAEWRLFLTVGLCGGFTTFSTFANENIFLLRDEAYFYFILYAGLTFVLGLAAVMAGNLLAKLS